ncbi:histidine phosphatase family protein [Nocardioides sp. YIM 152588]|uniref:histidine phosphatase family protein n=1 Tax=Nocardioides sp. YIM 152588 TaxID=3158259 RepID=UPI0032E50A3B
MVGPGGPPTTLVLVRHGVTAHTSGRRFSGGLTGEDPPLSPEGREQALLAARWLTELGDRVDAVIASPVRRTRETADAIAGELGLVVEEDADFAEMDFGSWEGRTFGEVAAADRAGMDTWLGDLAAAPHGGESFEEVRARVLAGLDRVLDAHAGRTVVLASHVTPIKTLVAHAVGAPLSALFALELAPASVSVVAFYPDGTAGGGRRGSLRTFNGLPPGRRTLLDTGHW